MMKATNFNNSRKQSFFKYACIEIIVVVNGNISLKPLEQTFIAVHSNGRKCLWDFMYRVVKSKNIICSQ